MEQKKAALISAVYSVGYTVFLTLAFVFGISAIIETKSHVKVMELGIGSIAPENLKSAPESFMLNLRAETDGFPVAAMTKTKAWRELQNKVTGYSARLELMERQNRQRRHWISLLALGSVIGWAVFSCLRSIRFILKMKKRRNPPPEPDSSAGL